MKKVLLVFLILIAWQLESRGQGLVVGFSFDTVCWHMVTHFRSWSYPDTVYPPRDSIISQVWDLNGDLKFDDGSGVSDSIIYDSPGIHTVGLKVTTLKGYVKVLYQLVPVNNLIPAFSARAGCLAEPVVFSNQTVIKGDTAVFYIWYFGDGSEPVNSKNPTHIYSDSGQYQVTLAARFRIGCQKDTIIAVKVAANPSVHLSFSRDTIMYVGDTLRVHVLDPSTFDSIRWSTHSTFDTIVITTAGSYSVKAYHGGCFAISSFNVTVNNIPDKNPVISNLFTPNGDGYNDYWEILNLSDAGPCQVNVFNRYGEQVYSSSDYQNDWDGTFKGKRLENDSYYYFVRCTNQVLLKGNVTILK